MAQITDIGRNRMLSLASILFVLACCVNAQPVSEPQAKSAEEFDDFLDILSHRAPAEKLASARRFTQNWPDSALLGEICRIELSACRQLGDSACAIQAGERALQKAPDNLDLLAEVAYLLADARPDAAAMTRADEYAHRVLTLVDTIQIPRNVSPQQWAKMRAELQAKAHTTLGLNAYNRHQPEIALQELETAKRLAPQPDAALFYRLGLLYRAVGDDAKAVEMLRQAAKSSDRTLRNLAEQQLNKWRAGQPPHRQP